MPGMFVQTMAFGLGETLAAVQADNAKGVMDRFRSMPIAPSAVVVGRSLAGLLYSVVSLVILIGARPARRLALARHGLGDARGDRAAAARADGLPLARHLPRPAGQEPGDGQLDLRPALPVTMVSNAFVAARADAGVARRRSRRGTRCRGRRPPCATCSATPAGVRPAGSASTPSAWRSCGRWWSPPSPCRSRSRPTGGSAGERCASPARTTSSRCAAPARTTSRTSRSTSRSASSPSSPACRGRASRRWCSAPSRPSRQRLINETYTAFVQIVHAQPGPARRRLPAQPHRGDHRRPGADGRQLALDRGHRHRRLRDAADPVQPARRAARRQRRTRFSFNDARRACARSARASARVSTIDIDALVDRDQS